MLGFGFEPVPVKVNECSTAVHHEFEYITENVAESKNELGEMIAGCQCDDCTPDNCPCMVRFGCSYDGRRKLMNVDPFDDNIRVLLECNSACMCNDSCINRVVQLGLQIQLEVFNTEKKGFGVRTLENIDKNTFVCEYTGELISSDQAKERRELQLSTSANYILCVNEYYGHTHEEIQATYIDATKQGNIGRLINHSCGPNLYMVPVKVNYMTSRMALFALKDIGVGEELSYDYSGNLNSSLVDQTDYPLKQHKKCFCGSLKCRIFLPFNLT